MAKAPSPLEDLLIEQIEKHGLPAPEREKRYPWAETGRRFEGDLLWPDARLLVEVNGGGQGGRHMRIEGYARDRVKINLAVLAGWRCLEVTSQQVKDGSALNWIAAALGKERLAAGVHPPGRKKKS